MSDYNEVRFSKLFQMISMVAEVVRTTDLTPRMKRITLGGDGLQQLVGHYLPADAIKLFLPEAGQAAFVPNFVLPSWNKQYNIRAYTIRRFNPAALELDIDVLLHGDSIGSVWARTAQPGTQVGFIGPRHEYRGAPNADWQVFAGDESALPAIISLLEHLPAGTNAHAFIEVEDAADELPIETKAAAKITWLHRGHGHTTAVGSLFERAVYGLQWPEGQGYFWVAGNAAVIRNIRRFLLNERHLGKENMYIAGYWR